MLEFRKKEDFLVCLRGEMKTYKNLPAGLKGLIEYRNMSSMHVDHWAKRYFKDIYGELEKDVAYADTIFNCWSIFAIFAKNRLIDLDHKYVHRRLKVLVMENYDEIFKGFEGLEDKFNELAELHHSFANIMPAPKGLNGYPGHDGKGRYNEDNDFPDIYYKRAERQFPEIYKWINENKEKYALDFYSKFDSGLENKKANMIEGEDQYEKIEKIVDDMILHIKSRANKLEQILK